MPSRIAALFSAIFFVFTLAAFSSDVGTKTDELTKQTADVLDSTGKKIEQGVQKAAESTGKGIDTAVKYTEKGVKKAAESTQKGLDKAAKGAEKGMKKAAESTGKTLDQAADMTEKAVAPDDARDNNKVKK